MFNCFFLVLLLFKFVIDNFVKVNDKHVFFCFLLQRNHSCRYFYRAQLIIFLFFIFDNFLFQTKSYILCSRVFQLQFFSNLSNLFLNLHSDLWQTEQARIYITTINCSNRSSCQLKITLIKIKGAF